jgi:phosphoribosyl 1,2-cyclic phosphodiesterase
MHEDFVSVLSSGSSGNSFLAMSRGRGVLIDAGISCRELERRMSLFGTEPPQIDAVLLTHEHTDHVRGAKRFAEEFGIPVYGSRGTLALTPLHGVKTISIAPSKELTIGHLHLRPFKVRHFAAEPVAFSVTVGSKKVSIASDLGCVTPSVIDEMSNSDIMFVEANYDENMLLSGAYPDFLKRAIKGDHGHLSNEDAGVLSRKASTGRTRRVVLVHLSKENNTPQKALETVERDVFRSGLNIEIEVSEHGHTSGPFALG